MCAPFRWEALLQSQVAENSSPACTASAMSGLMPANAAALPRSVPANSCDSGHQLQRHTYNHGDGPKCVNQWDGEVRILGMVKTVVPDDTHNPDHSTTVQRSWDTPGAEGHHSRTLAYKHSMSLELAT
jgi:hypothetical protein